MILTVDLSWSLQSKQILIGGQKRTSGFKGHVGHVNAFEKWDYIIEGLDAETEIFRFPGMIGSHERFFKKQISDTSTNQMTHENIYQSWKS